MHNTHTNTDALVARMRHASNRRAASARRAPQMDLRPIANIAKRYARKAIPMSTLNMSEGYEIARTCEADTVHLHYHPAYKAFTCEQNSDSVARGTTALASMAADLAAAGYTVAVTGLTVKVTL